MVDFADRVRVKATNETERLGLARLIGQIYGWTTPSSTGVSVIGSLAQDHAINVHFEETNADFWFSEDLLELVDHGAGTVIAIDEAETEWVRLQNGEWEERPRSGTT